MAGVGFEVSGGGDVGDGMFEVGVFGLVVKKRGDCRGDSEEGKQECMYRLHVAVVRHVCEKCYF
jgi:hypothetical protein